MTVSTLCLSLAVQPALARGHHKGDKDRFCSQTAQLAFAACGNEVQDDYLVASAICLNISDRRDRKECSREADTTKAEELEGCYEQRDARLEVCDAIGEGRYDPEFDPEDFVAELDDFKNNNLYLPLMVGNSWVYEGGAERIEVDVLSETKLIDDVTCIVVRDQVFEDGELVEDTADWEAQATNGNVWYCGEEAKDYETFDGDDPVLPELVSIDGSFKAGRDGDKAGLLFPGAPEPGQTYRQEFSLGNAEDMAEVLTVTFDCDENSEYYKFVERSSLETFCETACDGGDCVVTREFSPLDPGVSEWKYFAPGIGMFLEANLETGEIVELVEYCIDGNCSTP
jgi:hypothetical protein